MAKTIDPELLISLVENRPVIWDKTLEAYKDKKLRNAAWRDICTVLKEDFEGMGKQRREDYVRTVVNKWNQIRDSWIRTLKERSNPKTSGSGTVKVRKFRKYVYHNQLLFLEKIVKPAVTFVSTNNEETCDKTYQNDTIEEVKLETSVNQSEQSEDEISVKLETSVNQSEHETSIKNVSPRQEDSEGGAKWVNMNNIPMQRFNAIDPTKMAFIDHQHNSQNEDRSLSFFKSLLPTIVLLNDDQILEFQAGVISLLQNIKSRNRNV